MRIRDEQIEAFEEVRLPEFEDRMVEYLAEHSPLHSRSLGEKGIRVLIRAAMERAEKHEFTRKGPVQFYIETTILLGIDFDTDPLYPQIAEILDDASISDQTERADRVHGWLMGFLDAAGGPDRRYALLALQRARQTPYEGIPVSSPTYESRMIERLKESHPEKVAYLGEAVLRDLIPHSMKGAKKYNVATDAGVALFVGLSFGIGHGFVGDPKYPWVENTLSNAAVADPEKRAERLYSKTMTYLDHVLKHLEAK